jgi:3-dehydroquinate synthase
MIKYPKHCILKSTVKKLRDRYNCVGIKTSFEDEGANFNDMIKLREITSSLGIKLAIKVGGAEAKTDIKSSMDLCCDSIVGPMIETKYAFEKYIQSTKNLNVGKGINIETITAIDNIDMILSSQYLGDLDYFVIGRVDLAGSMEQSRDLIDSNENLKRLEKTFSKIKKTNRSTYMGGAISKKSKDFIRHLYSKGLLDYIETRYIIIKLDDEIFDVYDEVIKSSHEFELEWTKHLHSKYSTLTQSLESRISLAQSRVWKSFTLQDKQVSFNIEELKNDVLQVQKYNVCFINKPVDSYIQPDDLVIIDKKLIQCVEYHDLVYTIDANENNKCIETVMDIIQFINGKNIQRVVVIGGGLTQDVGSFMSSIYNRGTKWIYFPTTLLAMADSCIGSKTSLNTNVKNKIGTFYSPTTVYIHTGFLETLTDSDIKSGLGEILKLCMIGNSLGLYEKYKSDIASLIKLSLLIKRAVIDIDLFDDNIRKTLNYGHTVGHALEVMTDYSIPHGIAVVYGMLAENSLFNYSDTTFERLCSDLLVPIDNIDTSQIKSILLSDKKACANNLNFIVPKEPGKFDIVNREVTTDLCVNITSYLQKIQDQF